MPNFIHVIKFEAYKYILDNLAKANSELHTAKWRYTELMTTSMLEHQAYVELEQKLAKAVQALKDIRVAIKEEGEDHFGALVKISTILGWTLGELGERYE